MIDILTFSDLINELEVYYGRSLTPSVKSTWLRDLKNQLTIDEFEYAVEQTIIRYRLMPTVEQLLKRGKGKPEYLLGSADTEREEIEELRNRLQNYKT